MTASLPSPSACLRTLPRLGTLLLPAMLLGALGREARAQIGNVCETPIVIASLPFDDAGNTSPTATITRTPTCRPWRKEP